mgnify:CR=1 FL=1
MCSSDLTNPLCSVGVCLDPRIYPKSTQLPDEEFKQLISKYPSVNWQFQDSKAIRPWVSTNRIQYNSKTAIGDRFVLLPHAYGFIDPLFSSGLSLSGWAINVLGHRIIKAIKTKDYSKNQFEYYNQKLKENFNYYDNLVSRAFKSFDSFDLWNAWYRFWALGNFLGVGSLVTPLGEFRKQKKPEIFEQYPYQTLQGSSFEENKKLFESACEVMDQYVDDSSSKEKTILGLFDLLKEVDFKPKTWHLDNPNQHCPSTFTLWPTLKLLIWGRTCNSVPIKKFYVTRFSLLFNFVLSELFQLVKKGFRSHVKLYMRMLKESLVRS